MSAGLVDRLLSSGMSREAAARVAGLFVKADAALAALGGSPAYEPARAFVPGRIEVLGKHTDYAGGRSLLCAVERGFAAVATPRGDSSVRIVDAMDGSCAEFALDPEVLPSPGHWSVYPMTVARRIARNFPGAARGADIAFASDLPPCAGLSSSSAFLTAVFLLLCWTNALAERDEWRASLAGIEAVAGYLGSIENGSAFEALAGDRGVGTFGGSEDHTAILCARPGALRQYTFCPVRLEATIPLPADHRFVVGASGIAASKTGGAREHYNRASATVAEILRLWREATGRQDASLAAAAASSASAPVRLREVVGCARQARFDAGTLLDRLEQFLMESETIVPSASAALGRGDLEAFGALCDRSQEAAERLLGNQTPETSALARSARELGASAASAFGAGFGGSVWALVRADEAEAFRSRWTDAYAARFPDAARRAVFLVTPAGPPASAW